MIINSLMDGLVDPLYNTVLGPSFESSQLKHGIKGPLMVTGSTLLVGGQVAVGRHDMVCIHTHNGCLSVLSAKPKEAS